MLTCFPVSYPEELFYSVCPRYTDRMAFPKPGAVARTLFGIAKVSGGSGLAGNLDVLLNTLPPDTMLSAQRIVDEHTLFPFYAPFLEPHELSALRDSMNNQQATRTANGGAVRRTVTAEWLRYCQACVDDDRKRHGECYWHRVHQLPGVLLCPTHAIALCETDRRAVDGEAQSTYISLERWLQSRPPGHTSIGIPSSCLVLLHRLACDAQRLLCAHDISPQLEHLRHHYHALLTQRGLATHSGTVHVSALATALVQYYPAELLTLLGCRLNRGESSWWVRNLVCRTHGRSRNRPLHHLLLIAFLRESVAAFLQPVTPPAPFGDGPWPCLNPAASHYRELTITECTITYARNPRNRPTYGTFACACGYIYRRIGPDRTEVDRFRVGQVIAYGDEWDARFRQLWNDPSVGFGHIREQLRISSTGVAQRQAIRLGLGIRPNGQGGKVVAPLSSHNREASPSFHQLREHYRRTWLQVMASAPDTCVRELRGRVHRAYVWLLRYDREWYTDHRPPHRPRPTQMQTQSDQERASQDAQYAARVRQSAITIGKVNGRPRKVTRSGICRHTHISRLAHLGKLANYPLTRAALADVVETPESFAAREAIWERERTTAPHTLSSQHYFRTANTSDQRSHP